MKFAPNLRDQLDKVLAENRALIGHSYAEEFQSASFENSLDRGSLYEWYNQSRTYDGSLEPNDSLHVTKQRSGTPGVDWHQMSGFPTKSSFSSSCLSRLNDSLQASGFEPVARDPDPDDVVIACVTALENMSGRNRLLVSNRTEAREAAPLLK